MNRLLFNLLSSNAPGAGLLVATSAICLLVVVIYFVVILQPLSKDDSRFRKVIKYSALSIAALYALLDLHVMSSISTPVAGFADILPLLGIALLHSVEVFVFQTHFFDNGYEDFFFLGEPYNENLPNQLVLAAMVTLAVLAAVTSASLVVRALGKRRADRNWLSSHARDASRVHIFLQEGDYSKYLAEDIKAKPDGSLTVLVSYPNPDSGALGLSLWEKFIRLISPKQMVKGPFDAVIYSKSSLSDIAGSDLYAGLGLKEIRAYFENPECSLYLAGDDEDLNFTMARKLCAEGCRAEIFCRASREGAGRAYEEALSAASTRQLHIVDASYLAVRELKSRTELLPVNFVDKGTDGDGRREGWVAGGFNSMIVGFGEIGREALRFLYENGAFVGRDFRKSPFKCTAVDPLADRTGAEFLARHPALTEQNGVFLRQMEAGSGEFSKLLESEIATLNYVVICTGNDKMNLKLAVDLLESAYLSGRDLSRNFAILAAIKNPGGLDLSAVEHYNSIPEYGGCLHLFAVEKDIWTYDNITDASLLERAKKYFTVYYGAMGTSAREAERIWDERESEIGNVKDYRRHLNAVRKKGQDFANVFHIPTKLALMDGRDLLRCKEIADRIPSTYSGRHYSTDDPHEETLLRYLACGEHLRWEASHAASGYRPGPTTDALSKTHGYIKSYDDLPPEVRHWDYLVVKTTLELSGN